MRGRRDGHRLLGRLIACQLWADRGVALLLALVVTGTAFLAAAVPRAVDDVSTRSLRDAVTELGPRDRALTGSAVAAPLAVPPEVAADEPARPYEALVGASRDGPVANLRPWVREPQWDLRTAEWWLTGEPPREGPGRHFVLNAGSAWPDQVRFVDGRPPERAEAPQATLRAAAAADAGDVTQLPVAPPVTVEIAMSTGAARLMALQTGDELVVRLLDGTGLPEFRLVVTGLFEPLDPAGEFWELDPAALQPFLGESDREGTFRTASVYLGDGAMPVLARIANERVSVTTVTVRADVDPSALLPEDAGTLATAARRATAQTVPLQGGNADGGSGTGSMGFSTGLSDALAEYADRRAPVVGLAAVLLAGLLGCAVVVLFLAARLLLERRRSALALAVTRGASPAQGLGVLALEAFLVAVPAAAAGYLLTALLVPGRAGTVGVALTVLVALVPVVAVPVAAWSLVRPRRVGVRGGGPPTGRGRRLDAVLRRGPGAGVLLRFGVTAAAVAALLSRGVEADPAPGDVGAVGASAVDPLVAATPLLVAVSVALLAHRLVAIPVAAATRRAARRPGLVGFLGLARAGRSGVLGASATAALTVAIAVASLSAVTRETLDDGERTASWLTVGADLRVTSAGFGRTEAEALAAVPGVEAATPVTTVLEAPLSRVSERGSGSQSGDLRLTLAAADPVALADVQRDVPDLPALPRELSAPVNLGDDIPLVVSTGVAGPGQDVRFRVGARSVRGTVVGVLDTYPGMPVGDDWALAPIEPLRETTSSVLSGTVLLARAPSLAGTADLPRELLAGVSEATGPGTVTTPANWRAESTGPVLVRAVRDGVPVAVAAGGLLAALAVLLTLLGGGASRRRFLAHLRALGLSGRQAGSLVALEVLPGAVAALAGGLAAGLATAWLVLPAADLRPLTGGALEVPVTVGPWTVAAVALGFAAVLAAGVAAAAFDQRRVSPAAAARLGDAE
jgi:putative ABC transport system permease protein